MGRSMETGTPAAPLGACIEVRRRDASEGAHGVDADTLTFRHGVYAQRGGPSRAAAEAGVVHPRGGRGPRRAERRGTVVRPPTRRVEPDRERARHPASGAGRQRAGAARRVPAGPGRRASTPAANPAGLASVGGMGRDRPLHRSALRKLAAGVRLTGLAAYNTTESPLPTHVYRRIFSAPYGHPRHRSGPAQRRPGSQGVRGLAVYKALGR
jgi:hypothetical protein